MSGVERTAVGCTGLEGICCVGLFVFFERKTAYGVRLSLVGSGMGIRDRSFFACLGIGATPQK